MTDSSPSTMQPEQWESGAIGRNLGKALDFGSHVWMCEFIAGHTADATGQSGQILWEQIDFWGSSVGDRLIDQPCEHAASGISRNREKKLSFGGYV